MAQIKYIAAGFLNDANILLNDFTLQNSMEFSVFAEIWKKKNFSLIYMGRNTERELTEFTQEIFYLAGQYVTSSSLLYQVGGVFLLYGLYRNQIINPPVRIRIVEAQIQAIDLLRDLAVAECLRSLHYVIDFLFENAFEFVASFTLMGPNRCKDTKSKKNGRSVFKAESCLADIRCSELLEDVHQTFAQYAEVSKSSKWQETSKRFEKFFGRLDQFVEVSKNSNSEFKVDATGHGSNFNIGSRRAHLKAAQFARAIYPGIDVNQDADVDDPPESATKFDTVPKDSRKNPPQRQRKRKQDRKIGRPRKNALEKEDSESEDSDSLSDLLNPFLPSPTKPARYEKAPRIRTYYNKVSTYDGAFDNSDKDLELSKDPKGDWKLLSMQDIGNLVIEQNDGRSWDV